MTPRVILPPSELPQPTDAFARNTAPVANRTYNIRMNPEDIQALS
jgi:hypothetical protein